MLDNCVSVIKEQIQILESKLTALRRALELIEQVESGALPSVQSKRKYKPRAIGDSVYGKCRIIVMSVLEAASENGLHRSSIAGAVYSQGIQRDVLTVLLCKLKKSGQIKKEGDKFYIVPH